MLAAAQAVRAVLAGQSLSDSLARTPPAQRAAAQALSFHAMRRLGLARALQRRLVARAPADPLAHALLLLGLCLMDASLEPAEGRGAHVPAYAPHTVVHQAVDAAARDRRCRPVKGLINAVLRRYARERAQWLAQVADEPEARWNHPAWWVDALREAWPAHWQALLASADIPGPLVLRANARRTTPAQLCERLAAEGIDSRLVGADGLLLPRPRPVHEIPGYAGGLWSVQDLSAQQAARLLPLADGMRVLDACAAPGGKTAHMLERHALRLTAIDSDAQRLARIGQNLDRLGLSGPQAMLRHADAADPAAWWDGQAFDAILADVPCTASGVVRRHPDIRWLRRPEDLPRTAALQARIADALWPLLRTGGHLLYATCSIFPLECEDQVRAFLGRHPDARRLPAPGQILPLPGANGETGDGFFYALIAKHE